jgi:hypothetical protein
MQIHAASGEAPARTCQKEAPSEAGNRLRLDMNCVISSKTDRRLTMHESEIKTLSGTGLTQVVQIIKAARP